MQEGLKVNPEIVTQYGTNVNELGNEYNREITSLYMSIDELSNGWKGYAESTFKTTAESHREELKSLGTAIENIGADLCTIAKIYSETEQQIADEASKI